MWTCIYFVLSTIETISLFIYSLLQKSSLQERVWLHFSAEWLGLLSMMLLVCIALLVLTIQSIRARRRGKIFLGKILNRESSLWLVMILNVFMLIGLICLLVQSDDFFGDFLAIYQKLKPTLFWLLVLNLQTFFFAFIWYCVHFVEKPQAGVPALKISEMNVVLAVFVVSMLIKVVFVLPNGYGMLKDVGETKYLYMLQYFNEGIFLRSATEFTTHYPPLYPLSLMFTFFIRDYAFEGIKLLNALFASSLVFPVYLISRRFFNQKISMVIIVLTSLIPFQFLLPIRLLSENLYFSLLLGVLYLAFVQPADQHYRFTWDCLTGFSLGLLYLTRYISLALIPFLLLIWWLKPFNNDSRVMKFSAQKLVHALVMLFLTAITFMPWVYVGLDNSLTLSQMLGFGIAANTNPAQLTGLNLLKWMAFYAAYYVLLAAPVLNLLVVVMGSFRVKNLEDEKNRWVLTVLILMLAFGLAIVRHSWRADYNLELPKRLMGRYVIYFVPLFILTAFLSRSSFKKADYRNLSDFLLRCELLPIILVVLSYLLVIKGNLVPVNTEFIHPLISMDGYYIKLLGKWFFILSIALYTGSNLLLWYGKKGFTQFAAAGLMLYYLVGEPAYLNLMKMEQTSQQMGKLVLDTMLIANREDSKDLSYEIFLPGGMSHGEMDDLAWTIFINHPGSEWQVGSYSADKVADIQADAGIVVLPLEEARTWMDKPYQVVEINKEEYALQLVFP